MLWALFGVGAAIGLAMLDRALASDNQAPSHLGGALQSAGVRGYGYLWDIAARKAVMNARIAQHPAVLAAVALLFTVGWLAGGALRERAARLTADHREWARGLCPAGWGALAAFLFNDSGVVAALFILGLFLMSGLYFLFTDPTQTTT